MSFEAKGLLMKSMATLEKWVKVNFGSGLLVQAFSFVYGSEPSSELLKRWKFEQTQKRLDLNCTQHILSYTDPKTGLVVRCVAVQYHDFPTVEWTLYLKNTGSSDTPVIQDIQALDTSFSRGPKGEFFLHHNRGSYSSPTDFQPITTALEKGTQIHVSAAGGLSTNGDHMPYFNIEWLHEGVIVVIGWPGQWAARFMRDKESGLRVHAGQELTHFKLHPGEEVRSPRIVLQFWKGDWIQAQNVWRRWMLAHNTPKPGGKPLKPIVAGGNSGLFHYIGVTEENQKFFIDRYLEEKIDIDWWWVDAGWYHVREGYPWLSYGTWEFDKKRFPNGLRPVFDYAHSKGLKTVLWFCPEPVRPGTWLHEKHPEWLLEPEEQPYTVLALEGELWHGLLLNLAKPEVFQWLLNHVDRYITEQGIDVYRHDNDQAPLSRWRSLDTEDREGITEIRYVSNFLAFYDGLLQRHPNLLIDNCCAGGRRNDVETLRYSVPMWKSDYSGKKPVGMQCQTYGLALWIPFFGHKSGQLDPYLFRSNMHPGNVVGLDMRDKKLDYDMVRQLISQLRQIAPNLLGDYYPLTPYSLDNDVWMAWQFDRPKAGEGMVQAFRRAESSNENVTFKLRGLDCKAKYTVNDLDIDNPCELTGKDLMKNGLPVRIPNQPGAAVITYKKSAK